MHHTDSFDNVVGYHPRLEGSHRRRKFITLLGGAAAWPFAAMAQQTGRTYRLGCLLLAPRDAPIVVAFFDELRRHGFIEGQNLTVEYRLQHLDLNSRYAAELVEARVDVIATAGDETAPRRSTGDENHSDRCDRRRHAEIRTSDLAGTARRQHNGRQYPRGRG